MKKIQFNTLTLEVIDSWEDTTINQNYSIIYSQKIGESYCILSLYTFEENENDIEKLYASTLNSYKEKNNFDLVSETTLDNDQFIYSKRRDFQFYDEDTDKIMNCSEYIIHDGTQLYILSGKTPSTPLSDEYVELLNKVFNSVKLNMPVLKTM